MKKAKIFYGPTASGKTFNAYKIAKTYKNPAIFAGYKFNKLFRFCDQLKDETDLVVFDECPKNFDYLRFIIAVSGGLLIRTKGKTNRLIHPDFIFCSDWKPKSIGTFFDNRFELIECKNED